MKRDTVILYESAAKISRRHNTVLKDMGYVTNEL